MRDKTIYVKQSALSDIKNHGYWIGHSVKGLFMVDSRERKNRNTIEDIEEKKVYVDIDQLIHLGRCETFVPFIKENNTLVYERWIVKSCIYPPYVWEEFGF